MKKSLLVFKTVVLILFCAIINTTNLQAQESGVIDPLPDDDFIFEATLSVSTTDIHTHLTLDNGDFNAHETTAAHFFFHANTEDPNDHKITAHDGVDWAAQNDYPYEADVKYVARFIINYADKKYDLLVKREDEEDDAFVIIAENFNFFRQIEITQWNTLSGHITVHSTNLITKKP